MSHKFLDKSARVMVVDPSGAARQLLSESVRQLGFEDVQGVASIKDVIQFLETESLDWVICSTEKENPENLLSFLKLITVESSLRNIRLSALIEENETDILIEAFSLGLLSYFSKPFTKDSLKPEFEEFIEVCQASEGNSTLIAAHYLTRVLWDNNELDQALDLQKELLQLFPGQAQLLLMLAETLFKKGEKEKGRATLKQALILDPDLQEDIEELAQEYLDEEERDLEGADTASAFNALGLDTVVLVDPDAAIQNALKDISEEIGFKNAEVFNDGEEALAFLKEHPNPDLLIMEWRIPKVPGPIFIQRAIAQGAATTPIIVLSSLVKTEDMPLLKEMGVANIVEKPFDKSAFMKALIWTVQQNRRPTDQVAMESKIRKLIKAKNNKELAELVQQFINSPHITEGRKKLIEAEYAYYLKNYEQARDACIAAIKLSGDSILALNLLGKILMQLRDFRAALQCLKKAQTLSPQNVERLCHIAEAHTELGETDQAEETLNQASDLDPDSTVVAETKVKVAMSEGDLDKAKKMMADLESLESIVSFMNNKAVALARCGEFEDSISQYKKTLKALPDGRDELRARVYYNMALAHARASELEEAKLQIDKAAQTKDKKIEKKVNSLKKRLEHSLATGADFKLRVASDDSANVLTGPTVQGAESEQSRGESVSNNNDILAELKVAEVLVKRGEIGCYLLFNRKGKPSEEAQNMLRILPHFKARAAIEREETLKGEAMLKKSS